MGTNWNRLSQQLKMSKKKGDLRLKKRTDSSLVFSSSINRVQIPIEKNDFKPVNVPTKSRTLLHKLLFGDAPLKFTPFPKSQLFQDAKNSIDSADSSTPSEEVARDDEKGSKWTPFPPPNVDAILSKMPLVPLTMEQLCAPTSDDELEEREGLARGSEQKSTESSTRAATESVTQVAELSLGGRDSDDSKNDKLVIASRADMKHSTVKNDKLVIASRADMKHSTVSASKSLSHSTTADQHLEGGSKARTNAANSKPPKPRVVCIDLTDSKQPITSHSNRNSLPQSGEQQTSTHLAGSPAMANICKYIDLEMTDNQQPCTSRSCLKSQSSTVEPRATSTRISELEEDFDYFCEGIDLDTIDDFSDNSENARHSYGTKSKTEYTTQQKSTDRGSGVNHTSSHSYNTGKGKGKVGTESQQNLHRFTERINSRSLNTTQNNTSSLLETDLREAKSSGNQFVSQESHPSRPTFKYPTSTIQPATAITSNHASSKTASDLDRASSRSKRPRLDTGAGHQSHSGQQEDARVTSTTKPGRLVPHKHHTLRGTNFLPDSTTMPPLTQRQKATSRVAGSQPADQQSSGRNSIPRQNMSQQQHSSVKHSRPQSTSTTSNAARQTPTANASSLHQTVTNTQKTRPQTSTAPHSDVSSSSSHSRTTPLGSQLTTENCPLCNTKFPSWYEQVDADQHIARCLQAVMDLEMENYV